MTVAFELDGQSFTALNGGPHLKLSEALSLVVNCQDQAEVDHYWNHLSEGSDPTARQRGWLKDQSGVSWQVIPRQLIEYLSDPDADKARKAMTAMLQMKKIDIEGLRKAMA